MALQPKQITPLISVCIPVYNGEKYIRECIASVLAQNEKNFELLISDNCSTDHTLDVCNEFKDSRIRILKNDQNIGSIANFNTCIQNAIGELFVLLPCDDLLEGGCLELLSKGLINNPSVGIAFGSVTQIDAHGGKIKMGPVLHYDGLLDCEKAVRFVAENWNPLQHPMVRMKVFEKVGEFELNKGVFCDIYLWSKILFGGWDAFVVDKPLTALRCHKNQGQVLFRQNTKDNLKKLSDHYGYQLPSDFYEKNQTSLQLFRFIQFFTYSSNGMVGVCDDVEKAMLTTLLRSHLSNLYFSLRHLNLSSCVTEIALSAQLVKVYGLTRTLNIYCSTISSAFRSIF